MPISAPAWTPPPPPPPDLDTVVSHAVGAITAVVRDQLEAVAKAAQAQAG